MRYPDQTESFSLDARLQRHRGWIIALGVCLTILGVLAITGSVLTTAVTMTVLGGMLTIAGIIQIVQAFSAPRWSGVVLPLLEGTLYGVVGLLVVTRPLEGAA